MSNQCPHCGGSVERDAACLGEGPGWVGFYVCRACNRAVNPVPMLGKVFPGGGPLLGAGEAQE